MTLSPLLDALSLLPFDSRASIDDALDSSYTSFKPLSSPSNGRNLIIINCISTDEARKYVFVLFSIATITRSIEFAILYAPRSAAFYALSRLTPIGVARNGGAMPILPLNPRLDPGTTVNSLVTFECSFDSRLSYSGGRYKYTLA